MSITTSDNRTSVTLTNQQVRFTFKRAPNWQLTSLQGADGHEFIAAGVPGGPLWRLMLRHERYEREWRAGGFEKPIIREDVSLDSLAPAQCELEMCGDLLTLHWRSLAVGELTDVLDVRVLIDLSPDSPYAEWRLEVDNHSPFVGVERVEFPLIGPLAAGEFAELAVPNGWGQLIPNPSASKGYHGHFPCGTCDLQHISLCDGGAGLYLTAHDPQGYDKELVVTPIEGAQALQYALVTYPEGMGAVGVAQGYRMPYPAAIGAFRGNWLAGAKLYRAWLPQAYWWPQESLAERASTPQWLKETAMWLQSGGSAINAVPLAEQFAAYFEVPIATHWYSWHEIPFDDHYPEYFPPKEGFAEGVRAMQAAGVRVMPYINGRLWDPRSDSWRDERAALSCAKDEELTKYVEVYASHVALAVMCPTTEQWQSKIAGIVERLVGEYGVDAVYIDQVSAAPAKLCYDSGHPHLPGGGDFWVRGYRELLERAHTLAKGANPDSMLTTEDAAEPFADKLDAFLMCNSTRDGLIPLYPAIYSGRSLTFGRYIFDGDMADQAAFATKLGQMFIFGAQLGWMGAQILKPEYTAAAAFAKQVAKVRHEATKWMALGELVGFPELTPAPATLTPVWHMMNAAHDFAVEPIVSVTLPQVMGSLWRADDGSLALALVNMGAEAWQGEWACEGHRGEIALPAFQAALVKI